MTQERLSELFIYDADHGVLFWKARPSGDFKNDATTRSWNARFSGKEAGHRRVRKERRGLSNGVIVRIDGVPHLAHRLVFILAYGAIPNGYVVDHIDGDNYNNRLDNLRLATPAENQWNRARSFDSLSGHKGVSRSGNSWVARITASGITRHLGSFGCPTAAHLAYVVASRTAHGNFARP